MNRAGVEEDVTLEKGANGAKPAIYAAKVIHSSSGGHTLTFLLWLLRDIFPAYGDWSRSKVSIWVPILSLKGGWYEYVCVVPVSHPSNLESPGRGFSCNPSYLAAMFYLVPINLCN